MVRKKKKSENFRGNEMLCLDMSMFVATEEGFDNIVGGKEKGALLKIHEPENVHVY